MRVFLRFISRVPLRPSIKFFAGREVRFKYGQTYSEYGLGGQPASDIHACLHSMLGLVAVASGGGASYAAFPLLEDEGT